MSENREKTPDVEDWIAAWGIRGAPYTWGRILKPGGRCQGWGEIRRGGDSCNHYCNGGTGLWITRRARWVRWDGMIQCGECRKLDRKRLASQIPVHQSDGSES